MAPRAPKAGTVAAAVTKDLEEIRKRAPELAASTLAASALALAREIDTSANSATSKSMCARELRDTMNVLRELAPPQKEKDGIDEIAERRSRRRGATAADSPGT